MRVVSEESSGNHNSNGLDALIVLRVPAVSEGSELVLAQIPVTARLEIGSERLMLFLTRSRIIVGRIGKSGAGRVFATSFLGLLGDLFAGLFKNAPESRRKRRLEELSPQEILESDKDNFSIGLDEVVSVQIVSKEYRTFLTVLTRAEKLEFSTPMGLENIAKLFSENLGPKVRTTRAK